MKKAVVLAVIGLVAASGAAWGEEATTLILEAGNAVTFGSFTAEDATIDVETEYANPQGAVELVFAGPLAVGASYATSENDFTGEWEDEDDSGDGEVTAERTDMNAYVRLGGRDSVNLRLGFRSFKYEFSDGEIRQSSGEVDRNCQAEGELTTGADAELNLLFGDEVVFGVGVGASFFPDAEFTWEFDKYEGGSFVGRQGGKATVNAYSARVRPELSVKVNDSVRVFCNYTVQGTAWEETPDGGEDYAGVDVYSAAAVGVRVSL